MFAYSEEGGRGGITVTTLLHSWLRANPPLINTLQSVNAVKKAVRDSARREQAAQEPGANSDSCYMRLLLLLLEAKKTPKQRMCVLLCEVLH